MKLGAIGGNLSKTPKKWLKNSKKRAKMPVFLVEIRGFEPLTYTLRTYRATNCAISPNFGGNKWARTIDLLHVKQAL